jgi:hypothetical protein
VLTTVPPTHWHDYNQPRPPSEWRDENIDPRLYDYTHTGTQRLTSQPQNGNLEPRRRGTYGDGDGDGDGDDRDDGDSSDSHESNGDEDGDDGNGDDGRKSSGKLA